MSAVLGCLAVALAVLPDAAARRRFARVLGRVRSAWKVPSRLVFRVGVGLGVAGAAVMGIGPLLAIVVVVATVFVRRRQAGSDRRQAAECAALVEGLETVVGELRVGAHPSAAAATAASEVGGSAGRAFAVCSARGRLGGSAAAGLRDPESVIATELARVADAWQVAERHGLALADLLAAMRADLVSRSRFRARTVAALAGARATAAVLAALPLLGIALGQLIGAAPLQVLLTSGPGTVLLPLGTSLACAGVLWTEVITRKVLT
nr:type II secretion system F family protein [Nocardia transvalensis]